MHCNQKLRCTSPSLLKLIAPSENNPDPTPPPIETQTSDVPAPSQNTPEEEKKEVPEVKASKEEDAAAKEESARRKAEEEALRQERLKAATSIELAIVPAVASTKDDEKDENDRTEDEKVGSFSSQFRFRLVNGVS